MDTYLPRGAVLPRLDVFVDLRGNGVDPVRKTHAVKQFSGAITHFQHQGTSATFTFFKAILALFVRETTGAGHECERSAHQANEIAISDVDRGDRKPVAAILASLGIDNAEPGQFRQDRRQEFGGNVLCFGDLRELNRTLPVVVGKMLHGADGVSGFLRKHVPVMQQRKSRWQGR